MVHIEEAVKKVRNATTIIFDYASTLTRERYVQGSKPVNSGMSNPSRIVSHQTMDLTLIMEILYIKINLDISTSLKLSDIR